MASCEHTDDQQLGDISHSKNERTPGPSDGKINMMFATGLSVLNLQHGIEFSARYVISCLPLKEISSNKS
jgi:hypothetical protein